VFFLIGIALGTISLLLLAGWNGENISVEKLALMNAGNLIVTP
jgi:hypothetical protein